MGQPVRRGASGLRWAVLGVVLCLATGLLWGLSSAMADSTSPSPGAAKVTLHLGWVNDPDNLNPFIGYASSSFEIWRLNYDLLVGYAPDGSPRPELADSWDVSPDSLTWTFHLHPGVRWQDGVPFTAEGDAARWRPSRSEPLVPAVPRTPVEPVPSRGFT